MQAAQVIIHPKAGHDDANEGDERPGFLGVPAPVAPNQNTRKRNTALLAISHYLLANKPNGQCCDGRDEQRHAPMIILEALDQGVVKVPLVWEEWRSAAKNARDIDLQ